MCKLLIFSDSHGEKKEMLEVIKKECPDYIIHAGDYCCEIDFMQKNFSFFVKGNNDNLGQDKILFEIEGIKFCLIHGHKIFSFFDYLMKKTYKLFDYLKEMNVDILICGHTHIEMFEIKENKYILNPGSINFPRNNNFQKTYMVINIINGKIVEKSLKEAIKNI